LAAKITFLGLLLAAPLLVLVSPKPQPASGEAGVLLEAQPLLLRAATNISHTLTADFLWLASGRVGEIARKNEDAQTIYDVAQNVITADPFFFPAVNYFATYLSSIHDEVTKGAFLYELARRWDDENVLLYFYEIVLRVTYKRRPDGEAISELSREAYLLSEEKSYMKKKEVEEMIKGFILYARNKTRKQEKIRDDLLWLKEKSQSEERKAQIQELLDAIDRGY